MFDPPLPINAVEYEFVLDLSLRYLFEFRMTSHCYDGSRDM